MKLHQADRRLLIGRYCYISICSIVIAMLFAACGGPATDVRPQGTPRPAPTLASEPPIVCKTHSNTPVSLTMYYGSEKQQWIKDVVSDFNARNIAACDGPISVTAIPIGSGESMQQILAGTIKPDIWSPAGSVWLALLDRQWQEKYGTSIIPSGASDVPSLVTSPVVIAMWKPEAQALGWPSTPIGWSDIARLSTNPKGWAAFGHPEFGDFKFGHTHPDYSNSGLDAVIAENYAATNKLNNLTASDVDNAQTQDFVANVESSVIHYGDSTGFFADKMFKNGPSYLSAAVMYESLVVQANDGTTYPHLPYPVVAIYPKEGTFYSDHPFAILQASWVNAARQTSAQAFRNFLLSPEQQAKALHYGFRPASLSIPLVAPIDSAHGVDASEPKALLQVPDASVINAVKASWDQQRRKVDVMLVLDRSGSMNDPLGGVTKIEAAKSGMKQFVSLLGSSDSLGITVFSDQAQVLTPISALGPKQQQVMNTINNIVAEGNTRLFNTIAEQVSVLRNQPSKHIKAVVVLTDGMDDVNQMTSDQLVQQLTPSREDVNAGEGVKVFTIAYGSDADVTGLTRIATATGGQEYAGTPQNIIQVYQMISTFF